MKKLITAYLFLFSVTLFAQETIDHEMITRIKMETTQNNQLMETLAYLTDVIGPRLTNSPNYVKASEWCVKKLNDWGARAALEPWGTFGSGWYCERFNIEMIKPDYMRISGYPEAWSPGSKGLISGQPQLVNVESEEDYEKYRGKLRDAIIMWSPPAAGPNVHFEADAERYSESYLQELAEVINPEPYKKDGLEKQIKAHLDFFAAEGVRLLLYPSWRDHGIVITSGMYIRVKFPVMLLAREHYGRIWRLVEKGIPVQLDVSVKNTFTPDSIAYNVIAEIPGEDKKLKSEVVMLGAHLDSWHSASGATDNATGCAVMMEVIRILKTLEVKPKRTIRLALWSGEEQGLLGSRAYIKNHFGDPQTMALLPQHQKLSAYFNLDNGAGKIRGVYLQGNEQARHIFESYLQPFAYLGAHTITIKNEFYTDHQAFDEIGLPGFQFIQDPIEYETVTHHTNMDLYEAVIKEDLEQATMVIASIVYHTAMRDEQLPRKPRSGSLK